MTNKNPIEQANGNAGYEQMNHYPSCFSLHHEEFTLEEHPWEQTYNPEYLFPTEVLKRFEQQYHIPYSHIPYSRRYF
jgi:hypothetical protein